MWVKNLAHKIILLYGFVISGVVQSLIAFFQKSSILASNHVMFDISGSFGNPRQLGGYLAVCSVVSICLLISNIKGKNKLLIDLLTVSLIIQIGGLYLADSRAGFLALAVGITLFFIPTIKKYKRLFFSIMAGLILSMSIALYFYRPASANGRLLVWRVSTEMIADKPFFGHGIGAFSEKYMLYQAKYFSENPTSVFISVADNVVYPFNELLNVTIQQGIIGLLLFLAIFYFAFRVKDNRIFKVALTALAVFSMFSYPAEIFPLLLLFSVCLGGLVDSSDLTHNSVRNKMVIIILCLFVVFFVAKDLILINQLSNSYKNNNMILFEQSYEKMQYNHTYHYYYMDWLMEQPNSEHSERIKKILPSCENYCLLAEYFWANKNYEQAETTLRTAANMIPTRLRPKYLLWQLYVETKNTPAALEKAQDILVTPVKIESVYTLKVKAQMRKYLF
ncbi:ligase [Bacteroidia bacterium]|nr:ligase [Bacteroidia bacterium]